ncbi:MAG TPA: VWA domain-containing protein [Pyrinomonadaceae bacterium]|nr:VWA domain-containing protein [Pyrinomonadaceae bacterium]
MKLPQFALSLFAAIVLSALLITSIAGSGFAQSRRQPPTSNEKKNKRPGETGQGEKKEEPPPDLVGRPQDAEKVTVTTQIVNVDTVVYHKKSGQIVTGLKKENFAIFADGQPQVITNFSTPEAPITVAMVVEYSKWSEVFGYYGSGGFDPGTYEVIRPTAMFLSRFIKPPDDYVSVVAFDIRPTPLTDFTNDPGRISQVINLLLRNTPAFRETNLFDALKFVLVGGRGDSVVLDNSKSEKSDYAGLVSVQGRRRAVILIASGIDTFSKINYGDARKVLQNAGIPIYIIGTANLFFKKYEGSLDATDSISGSPGRMTFYQAQNTLKTFAGETGGAYYPVTFPGELPSVLGSINALLRSQYSLAFNPGDVRDGKQHKIKVSVDINGDGVYDDKEYVIQARQFYNAPKPDAAKQ